MAFSYAIDDASWKCGHPRTTENTVGGRCRVCRHVSQKKHREKSGRDHDRLKKYGLSKEAHAAMLADQGGVCAACGGPPSGIGRHRIGDLILHVDHDHVTGRVRGLLCGGCNIALGHLNDDPARLDALKAYLLG